MVSLTFLATKAVIISVPCSLVNGFVPLQRSSFLLPTAASKIDTSKISILHMSSIGDGNNGGGDGKDKSDDPLGDFLDPKKAAGESENLKRARAQISETSLPINFEEDGTIDTTPNDKDQDDLEFLLDEEVETIPTGKIDLFSKNSTSGQILESNPYLQVVAKLSPSDIISKFTSTAHPRVQDAVRATILGLIGTLPKMAFETTTITTGERLASLMFQLQMTGYMFKNAEYRLSLSQSLGMQNGAEAAAYLIGGDEEDEDEDVSLSSGRVKGKIKVSYDKTTVDKKGEDASTDESGENDNINDATSSMEVEVDAAAYMSELRSQVSKLRDDLISTRKTNEETVRKDLLLYIRTLPEQQLRSLTGTMSDDVLNAMKGLVNVVMSGIGEGQVGPETVTEQSGEAMAQLCMWQLVVGYNLRELEVREEMKNNLTSDTLKSGAEQDDSENEEGSIDYSSGGFE